MGHPLGAAGSRAPSPPAPTGQKGSLGSSELLPQAQPQMQMPSTTENLLLAIFQPREASASAEGGETCHPHAGVHGLSLFALLNSELLNLWGSMEISPGPSQALRCYLGYPQRV